MKESYEKGLTNHSAPNPTLREVTPWVWHGQGVHAGQPLSSEILLSACRPCHVMGKATSSTPQIGEAWVGAAESKNLCMRENFRHENRENLSVSVLQRGDATATRNDQKTSPTVQLI